MTLACTRKHKLIVTQTPKFSTYVVVTCIYTNTHDHILVYNIKTQREVSINPHVHTRALSNNGTFVLEYVSTRTLNTHTLKLCPDHRDLFTHTSPDTDPMLLTHNSLTSVGNPVQVALPLHIYKQLVFCLVGVLRSGTSPRRLAPSKKEGEVERERGRRAGERPHQGSVDSGYHKTSESRQWSQGGAE